MSVYISSPKKKKKKKKKNISVAQSGKSAWLFL